MQGCVCGGKAKFKAADTRTVLSVVGHIDYPRRRYHCAACRNGTILLDAWAGVGARSIAAGARRLITLAGTSWSFDRASPNLREFSHLSVSDDTIERVCQEEGLRAQAYLKTSDTPARMIRRARGELEFSTGGTCINTVDEWRELRLCTVPKCVPNSPCDASPWDNPVLNEATAKLSICAIAPSQDVGKSWSRLSKRLRLRDESIVHAIADVAKWIWEQAGQHLPKNNGPWCVDVFHVSQHIHQCGRELFGEGQAARDWADKRLITALKRNGPTLIRNMKDESQSMDACKQRTMEKLLTYLRSNRDRMYYADRPRAGHTIGSGQIEGRRKNTIGARMKIDSARWRPERADRIGTLQCVKASNLRSSFWSEAA